MSGLFGDDLPLTLDAQIKRKQSPAHDFWHRRVEGQIKGCMNEHPGWFNRRDATVINSLAKRIVGEIVAVMVVAPSIGEGVPAKCAYSGQQQGAATVLCSGRVDGVFLSPDRVADWFDEVRV